MEMNPRTSDDCIVLTDLLSCTFSFVYPTFQVLLIRFFLLFAFFDTFMLPMFYTLFAVIGDNCQNVVSPEVKSKKTGLWKLAIIDSVIIKWTFYNKTWDLVECLKISLNLFAHLQLCMSSKIDKTLDLVLLLHYFLHYALITLLKQPILSLKSGWSRTVPCFLGQMYTLRILLSLHIRILRRVGRWSDEVENIPSTRYTSGDQPHLLIPLAFVKDETNRCNKTQKTQASNRDHYWTN